jgi:hypothetical protein
LNVLGVLFRVSVFGGIVLLSRNAVLRIRELYADVRASTWVGGDGELRAALETLLPERRLPRWLLVHPDPRLRRRLLDDTDPLFQAGAWNAFGIGTAAAIAVVALFGLLAEAAGTLVPMTDAGFSPPIAVAITMVFVPFLVIVPLTTMAAVVTVWRGAFLNAIRGYNPRLMIRTALPLATGAVFGIPVFFGYPFLAALSGGEGARYMAAGSLPLAGLLLGGAALIIVAILGLSSAFMLYLSWVQLVARAWLPVALRQRTPRPVWAAGIVAAGALSLLWFSCLPVLLASVFAVSVESLKQMPTSLPELAANILSYTRLFPLSLLTLVSLVAVWAYPMAASFRWPSRDGASCWALLDPGTPVSLAQPLLRVGRSLLVGIAGGVIGSFVLWFALLDLPPGVVYQFYLPRTPIGRPPGVGDRACHCGPGFDERRRNPSRTVAGVRARDVCRLHGEPCPGCGTMPSRAGPGSPCRSPRSAVRHIHADRGWRRLRGFACRGRDGCAARPQSSQRQSTRAELPTHGTPATRIFEESVTARHASVNDR